MSRPVKLAEVCRELLGSGVPVRFVATGSSMAPAIRDGETVTVVPVDASTIRSGDVVLADGSAGLLAHRVVGVCESSGHCERRLRIQGDNRLREDPPVTVSQVLGRVALVARAGRSVPVAGPGWPAVRVARSVATAVRRSAVRLIRTMFSLGLIERNGLRMGSHGGVQ